MSRTKAITHKDNSTSKTAGKAVVQKPTPKTTKPKAVRARKTNTPPEEVLETEPVDVESPTQDESTVEDSAAEPTEKRKRSVPTKESVLVGFDELVLSVDEEITKLRESSSKAKGVKFLRSLNKKVKTLRSQAARVMKQRQRSNRKNNKNSGFLKPVPISGEMSKFTGWDPEELHSRVEVTKYICKYIKDNDLQNPKDRRVIRVDADSKLRKLLAYNTAKDPPLTYYRLQTFMKRHFLPQTEEDKQTS
jgi:chromatin remodeling complex protein RSC6